MSEEIKSPYEYFGENNTDIRNEIQAQLSAKDISVGIDVLNFLTTTVIKLIARRPVVVATFKK